MLPTDTIFFTCYKAAGTIQGRKQIKAGIIALAQPSCSTFNTSGHSAYHLKKLMYIYVATCISAYSPRDKSM